MGFFSDFVGSFTGSNERRAGRKAAEGFTQGIEYTKQMIEETNRKIAPLMAAAFDNTVAAADAGIDARKQTLAAQLALLGAGKEELSPEGASNALSRGRQSATDVLLGASKIYKDPLPFTKVSTNPITTTRPDFKNVLLGDDNA